MRNLGRDEGAGGEQPHLRWRQARAMPELPPDAAPLQAIRILLEEQIADHEAVSIYLRLHQDAVRQVRRVLRARQRAGSRPAVSLGDSPLLRRRARGASKEKCQSLVGTACRRLGTPQALARRSA